jgi:hypothetical protein
MAIDTNAPKHGERLDCGHVLSVPQVTRETGTGATGYARDKDDKTMCYACAHVRQLESMERDGDATGYLGNDGKHITDLVGQPLLTVLKEWQTKAGGFCNRSNITRVWARDQFGRLWHGRGPGRGMYIRMRRSKDARRQVA